MSQGHVQKRTKLSIITMRRSCSGIVESLLVEENFFRDESLPIANAKTDRRQATLESWQM